ncbi:MAG: hypothetical protein ACHP6I_02250 [Rickettsiales bacterium]
MQERQLNPQQFLDSMATLEAEYDRRKAANNLEPNNILNAMQYNAATRKLNKAFVDYMIPENEELFRLGIWLRTTYDSGTNQQPYLYGYNTYAVLAELIKVSKLRCGSMLFEDKHFTINETDIIQTLSNFHPAWCRNIER